jgi:sulfoxide reductase heme-binding subunit YedZ
VILLALAVTSTDGMIRRLRKWWGRLHKLVYAAAVLGAIHYYWLVKADHRRPLRYAAVIVVLLAYRAAAWLRSRALKSPGSAPPAAARPAV